MKVKRMDLYALFIAIMINGYCKFEFNHNAKIVILMVSLARVCLPDLQGRRFDRVGEGS